MIIIKENLDEIASFWGFNNIIIKKTFEAKGGRSVDLISTEQGDFILKVFNTDIGKKQISKFTLALQYLNNKNIKLSPKVIESQTKQLYSKFCDRYVYLMEYVEGRQLNEVPEEEYALGQAAAVLHTYDDYCIESELNTNAITKDMYQRFYEYPFKKEYDKVVEMLPDFDNYKKAFIHTDIGSHNAILSKEGKIIFVDFDDAGRGSIYIDAGYPLITQFVRYQKNGELKFNYDNAKAFYEGYFSKQKPNLKEKELIFHGAVFMQLMYMPCYGEEGVKPMWEILNFALKNRDRIMSALK